MIMYAVVFSKKAARFVEKLDRGYKDKVKKITEILRENPFAYPYKKIRGEPNLYRIRVGKYRILYEIDRSKERINIIKVSGRGKAY